MSQQGKVALVTGGAEGIGRAFVESLLAEGASVAICDINRETGEKTAEELRKQFGDVCIFLRADVTDTKELEDCFKATIERFKRLDIVLNNAGIADEKDPGWRKVVDVNLVAVIQGTNLGFKYMSKERDGRGGVVVNTASITALHPFPSIPVYSCTKAAVNQYSRSVGSDLYFKKSGVKVLALNPGMTVTSLTQNAHRDCIVQEPDVLEHFGQQFGSFPMQPPANLGRGLIEILKNGENGSMWLVNDSKPPILVTPQ